MLCETGVPGILGSLTKRYYNSSASRLMLYVPDKQSQGTKANFPAKCRSQNVLLATVLPKICI